MVDLIYKYMNLLAEQERKDEFVDYESFSGHKNRSSKKMH
jgi:hypothetical protein